jgi:hypothetical protein
LENKRAEQVLPGSEKGVKGRWPKQCIHMLGNVKMMK